MPEGASAAHPQAAGRRDDHVRPPRQLPGLLLHVEAAHYDTVLRVGDGTECISTDAGSTPSGCADTLPGKHRMRSTFSVMPAPRARNWSANWNASSLRTIFV